MGLPHLVDVQPCGSELKGLFSNREITMKKLFLCAFAAATVLAGCGGGDDAPVTGSTPGGTTLPSTPEVSNVFDKYVGNWTITFRGDDSGRCTVNVPITSSQTSARVTGTCFSTFLAVSFPVDGTLSSNGSFKSGNIAGDGTYMTGNLLGSSGSGQWTSTLGRNVSFGSWTASR